ncbi:MAG: hypothetical protein HQK77_21870 [Desulfobacterales bacterium]|nr:hypothetical protein [Desulfobacterales bacterium]
MKIWNPVKSCLYRLRKKKDMKDNMAEAVPYLDCCNQPVLKTVKSLYSSNHDSEALRQCQNCKRYWFYRFSEYVSYITDDDLTVWYSSLTEEEAETILNSQDMPDLSFLSNRPSFMKDAEGVKQVHGQPTRPWT